MGPSGPPSPAVRLLWPPRNASQVHNRRALTGEQRQPLLHLAWQEAQHGGQRLAAARAVMSSPCACGPTVWLQLSVISRPLITAASRDAGEGAGPLPPRTPGGPERSHRAMAALVRVARQAELPEGGKLVKASCAWRASPLCPQLPAACAPPLASSRNPPAIGGGRAPCRSAAAQASSPASASRRSGQRQKRSPAARACRGCAAPNRSRSQPAAAAPSNCPARCAGRWP